jgi:hypothetical protein
MTIKIAVLTGDGIGPEIIAEAVKVLECLRRDFKLKLKLTEAPVGGAGYETAGHPLPPDTLKLAKRSDAILLGAVGGPQWEKLDRPLRPEQGLLGLRSKLQLFANLRPAILYPQLAAQAEQALLGTQWPIELLPMRTADGAEQNRIAALDELERVGRQRMTGGLVTGTADRRFCELELQLEIAAQTLQHLHRLGDDLRSDAIAGEHCNLVRHRWAL